MVTRYLTETTERTGLGFFCWFVFQLMVSGFVLWSLGPNCTRAKHEGNGSMWQKTAVLIVIDRKQRGEGRSQKQIACTNWAQTSKAFRSSQSSVSRWEADVKNTSLWGHFRQKPKQFLEISVSVSPLLCFPHPHLSKHLGYLSQDNLKLCAQLTFLCQPPFWPRLMDDATTPDFHCLLSKATAE